MTSILAALHLDNPDSLKRALAASLGGLLAMFGNPFLASHGLPTISDQALTGFVAIVVTFLLQSGANAAAAKLASAKTAGDQAAAPILTPSDAAAALTTTAKVLALVLLLGALVLPRPALAQDVPYALDAGSSITVTGPAVVLPGDSGPAAARRVVACEAERDQLRTDVTQAIAWWVPVVVGVVALGAGASAGYAIARAGK